ncbi:NAD-dependent epimerase/dehydratase family protein [Candidatus Poriferisocius sp.]|uniref:NAD-dependent epimerase/dehydratase family protein n=1 Tax=Candidatus Poriferisocius sp. TaxID=3101276 RepID=UPI003B5CB81F
MLQDQKILITGMTGQIAFPMAAYLAEHNEVWGIARFSAEGSRERVEAAGVHTEVVDVADGDFSLLPDDFDYLVHMAAYQSPGLDYDWALRVNAEGTGLLMAHCSKAKAALIASTCSVYHPQPDPWHHYTETDRLGDSNAVHAPTYSMSKISEEAVARTMARALGLPTTVARINASYGPNGGLAAYHLDWIMAGQPVRLRAPAPSPYSPIHQDDMNEQVEPLLAAASVPATVVNWGGDEAVTAEDWVDLFGELSGREPEVIYDEFPGSQPGNIADPTRRIELTGPCRVPWRDGMSGVYEARYPGGRPASDIGGGERLTAAYGND